MINRNNNIYRNEKILYDCFTSIKEIIRAKAHSFYNIILHKKIKEN